MPELSRFYGIVIRMYYDDHGPPHFHAYYGYRPDSCNNALLECSKSQKLVKFWNFELGLEAALTVRRTMKPKQFRNFRFCGRSCTPTALSKSP